MKYILSIICLFCVALASCEKPAPVAEVGVDQAKPVAVVKQQASTPKTAPPTVSRGADISLEWDERDFGTIWDFESVTTTFPFTNTGSKTLVLSRLQAGCGCTKPVADKTILQPGESGTITVT
ncbi:MAG: DUF1573 domain-containing protein, partial [Phycisphaerales bacterium]